MVHPWVQRSRRWISRRTLAGSVIRIKRKIRERKRKGLTEMIVTITTANVKRSVSGKSASVTLMSGKSVIVIEYAVEMNETEMRMWMTGAEAEEIEDDAMELGTATVEETGIEIEDHHPDAKRTIHLIDGRYNKKMKHHRRNQRNDRHHQEL